MTLSEFLGIAREMRSLQKEFFGTSPENRRPNLVLIVRRAEKRFDDAIEEMSRGQRGLFDGSDE